MARLIHLNGPPGIGKSTIARRYVQDHPGVLDCDIDHLRQLIGGWEDDFAGTGELVRPAALAMISAYLAAGGDVVLPQMLLRTTELERFEATALEVGGTYVEVVLLDGVEASVARFGRRGIGSDEGWHDRVRQVVRDQGGDDVLRDYHRRLLAVLALRPAALVVDSVDGDVEATYAAVLAALDRWDEPAQR